MADQEYLYTCNHCGRGPLVRHYHLVGSEDYDLCEYDYFNLDLTNQSYFSLVDDAINAEIASVSGGGGGGGVGEDEVTKASPEEDYFEAMYGIASDDDLSEDSMSVGSLDDFVLADDDNFIHQTEEILADIQQFHSNYANDIIGQTETTDFDEFMQEAEDDPFMDLEEGGGAAAALEPGNIELPFGTIVNEETGAVEDWDVQSDNEAACDAMEDALDDDVEDFHCTDPETPLIVRSTHIRDHGKRQIKPVQRWTYGVDQASDDESAEDEE